jgi:hypothetical protein
VERALDSTLTMPSNGSSARVPQPPRSLWVQSTIIITQSATYEYNFLRNALVRSCLREHQRSRSAIQRCKLQFLNLQSFLTDVLRLDWSRHHRSRRLLIQGPSSFVSLLLPVNLLISFVLSVAGASVFENTTDISSYSYDSAKKELVSYDTPNIIKLKTQYLNSKGLGGSMFWEVSYLVLRIGYELTIVSSFLLIRPVRNLWSALL